MKTYDFENREQLWIPSWEKHKRLSFTDLSQTQDTWGYHENHPEGECTVSVYNPSEETCNEEKLTDGRNGSVSSPSKKIH